MQIVSHRMKYLT